MIALIHGSGTGIFSKLLPDRQHNGGFFIFDSWLKDGRAHLFNWATTQHLSWAESFWIPVFIDAYRRDRQKMATPQLQLALAEFLTSTQPTVIVAHSLGTELLWEILKTVALPASVKRIVFVQSALPHQVDPQHQLAQLLQKGQITLLNTYTPFDPNLLLGSWLHHQPRAGLIGLDLPGATNLVLPWLGQIDIHSSPLSHSYLLELCQLSHDRSSLKTQLPPLR